MSEPDDPPDSPAPGSAAAERQTAEGRAQDPPLRAPWVRPVALLILVFVLPLDWTRTETSGCGSSGGEVRIQTGYEHLFVSSELGILVSALAVVSLVVLWSAHKNAAWRLFFSGAALLINFMLASLVVFDAMFQLFNKMEVLPGAWLAFSTCGVLVLEPLLRFGAALVAAIKRLRARRRERAGLEADARSP